MNFKPNICKQIKPLKNEKTMNFYEILWVVLIPILKMGSIIGGSYAIFKYKLLSYKIHNILSKLVLYITLPMLLVSSLIMATDLLDKYPHWYWLPIIAVIIMCVSGFVGRTIAGLTLKKKKLMTICFVMCFFHNAGYFPLVIVAGIFPKLPDLGTLVMISVIGVSPLLWTLSPYLISEKSDGKINLKKVINPPVVSVILGLTLMMLNIHDTLINIQISSYTLIDLIVTPMRSVGGLTVTIILIVLGGSLSKIKVTKPSEPRFLITYLSTKLLIIPAIGFLVIPHLPLEQGLKIVLLVSTMQPTALAMTVQAKEFAPTDIGEVISESLLYVYILCGITLTIFLTILKMMISSNVL